jgi:sec-independent protein translocase protein TatB
MFENVGWPELLVIAMVGLFVLGPERLPAAAAWVASTVRTIRDYAVGARDQLRSELGPELDEFRKPLEDLRSVRDLDPRRAVRQHLLAEPPADGTWSGTATPATPDPAALDPTTPYPATPDLAGAGGGVAGSAATHGVPAEGPSAQLKGRSDRATPLTPGEIAPLDPDAT